MQILASALPGFRDLRAPIIAGYMWLLLAWLWVNPDLDNPPDSGIAGSLYDLLQRTGPIWVAVAAGVVAYFVGSVSQEISRILRAAWEEFGPDFRSGALAMQSDQRIQRDLRRGQELIGRAGLPSGFERDMTHRLEARARDAEIEGARELELPATLLVGDQSELFAEVDRLRAEGELRMAVVPPLAALTTLLVIQGSLWWLLLVPAIVVLFAQGLQREQDSRKSIADAIWIGRVESSSASKFSQWVDDSLLADIKEAKEVVDNDQTIRL